MKSYWNNLKNAIQQLAEKYPFLLYFLLAIVVFWPLSLGIYSLQYDAIDVYLPWRFFGSESLRQGMVPLWNPFQDAGYPFYADHQYSIWNPELFLVSLFTRYNASVLQWLFIVYLAIGGTGFRFLLKQFDIDKRTWFMGGVLFMLSGVLIGHGQSVVSILGAVWLPWALGSYIKAVKNGFRLKDILGLILFMYLMLAAGYQAVSIMLFYVVLVIAGYYAVQFIRRKEYKALKKFLLGHLFTGIGLGILLAGVVISIAEVFPYLSRLSGLSIEETNLVRFRGKSLMSAVYPLASVQKEYRGTAVSAQNIYSGAIALFFLFYSFKGLRKKLTAPLWILMIFGVIFGIASFGSTTPLQPLMAKFLPGCDQFYYAIFYRYFTWIALLILVCIGLDRFLNHGKMKQFIFFLGGMSLFYLLSALTNRVDWDMFVAALEGPWHTTMRHVGWNLGLFIQSVAQVIILVVFILLLVFKQRARTIVIPFMIIEIALISQFNIPVTVHGESRTATIDTYLDQFEEGFFAPSNGYNIRDYERYGQYGPIWKNQGNFNNLPKLDSWTSFHLIGREEVKYRDLDTREWILDHPLAYTVSGNTDVTIEKFEPNRVVLHIDTNLVQDTLVLQQAMFPGWTATVNNRNVPIELANTFLRKVPIPPGTTEVVFSYANKRMEFLFYLTMFGFLAVVFAYAVVTVERGTLMKRIVFFSALYGLIIARVATFSPTPGEGFELKKAGEELSFNTALGPAEYAQVANWLVMSNDAVEVNDRHMDDDIQLTALLHYRYQQANRKTACQTFSAPYEQDTAKVYLDSINRYGSVVHLNDIAPNRAMWKGHLLFGMEVHEIHRPESVFVVVEVKEGDQLISYNAFDLKRWIDGEDHDYFTSGYLLPPVEENQTIDIWIWNNSDKNFTFSNFRVKLLDQ